MADWGDEWGSPTATTDDTTDSSSRRPPRTGNSDECFNCRQPGHRSFECPQKSNGGGGGGSLTCRRCNQTGHFAKDCSEPDTRGPLTCHKCKETGHISRSCPQSGQPQNYGGGGGGDDLDDWGAGGGGNASGDAPATKSNVCYNCREEGHRANECPKPKDNNCRKCHKPGHTADECQETNWLDESGNPRPPPSDYKPAILSEEALDDAFFNSTVIPAGENFDSHLVNTVQTTGYENEADKPEPMQQFSDIIKSETILNAISKSNYKCPTLIQQYAIPVLMQGLDVMACAQTGSGKTVAFLAPILQKIFTEHTTENLESGYGQTCQKPIALVITPTRELADQIYTEAFKFTAGSFVKSCVIYGGTSTKHLVNQLNKGCHLLVSTVGRLHDFIGKGWVSFEKLKYLILDEADRMIDDGFMPEIRKLITLSHFPAPGARQTVMFSATFSESVQREAREVLASNYIFISVGRVGGANSDVSQEVFEVENREKKTKLNEILDGYSGSCDRIMIFVATKKTADFLATLLSSNSLKATSIHGDRFQNQREEALRDFKSGKMPILVATSVAARGIDIKDVRLVINYDLPDHIDDYVHRIGRTGRVGNVGKAISFYDPEKNGSIAESLVKVLRDSNQVVPEFLIHAAGKGDIDSFNQDYPLNVASTDVRIGGIGVVPQPSVQSFNHLNGQIVMPSNSYNGLPSNAPVDVPINTQSASVDDYGWA